MSKSIEMILTFHIVMFATSVALSGEGDAKNPRHHDPMLWIRLQAKDFDIEPTASGFLAGLSHQDRRARALCLDGLSVVGDLEAVGPMSKLLDDKTAYVRKTAVRSINYLVSKDLRSKADILYKDAEDPTDRIEAAVTLCKVGDPSRFRDLLDVLHRPESDLVVEALGLVKPFARYLLYDNGNPVDWVGAISPILMNRELPTNKRECAFLALQDIGSSEALSAIMKAEQDETDKELKYALGLALRQKPRSD